MNERIKLLRKALHLTQQGMANRLGVKRNTVAQWEIGINNLSDQVIRSICREFHVNEEWLREGNGEMFLKTVSFDLTEYAKSRGASDLELELAKIYFSLPQEIRSQMMEALKACVATSVTRETKEKEKTVPPLALLSNPSGEEEKYPALRAEAEEYYQELILEEEEKGRSSASPGAGGAG